jgi:hypothetical protein
MASRLVRNAGCRGDYDPLHAMAYAQGSAPMFRPYLLRDGSNGLDHIRLVRADFDNIFADGFG